MLFFVAKIYKNHNIRFTILYINYKPITPPPPTQQMLYIYKHKHIYIDGNASKSYISKMPNVQETQKTVSK